MNYPLLDNMLEDILALLPVLNCLTPEQEREAKALRTLAFRVLKGCDPVNPAGYVPADKALEWPKLNHEPMDDQLACLCTDVMFTLPNLDDDGPEEDQAASALYTICWKIVHGFHPPCCEEYVPKGTSALDWVGYTRYP